MYTTNISFSKIDSFFAKCIPSEILTILEILFCHVDIFSADNHYSQNIQCISKDINKNLLLQQFLFKIGSDVRENCNQLSHFV